MKRFHVFAAVCVLTASATAWVPCAVAQTPGGGHDLTVKVTDVKGKEGAIVISLYTTPDGFPDNAAKAARTAKVSPNNPTQTFPNLPAGKYVVVVFQDKNGNGRVDKSAFGPREPLGLSNHPKIGVTNRPDFEKAKVAVAKATLVEVNLIDFGR